MNKLKRLLWIVIVLLAIWAGFWVVVDNPDAITVRLLGFEVHTMPVGLWLLITCSAGFIVGLLAATPSSVKSKHRANRLSRQLEKSQAAAAQNQN